MVFFNSLICKKNIREYQEKIKVMNQITLPKFLKYQKAFGYSTEDIEVVLKSMALDGKEPIGSMGTDTPLAILSDEPQHLSSYFKQLFAQVTNPPIDPIREKIVMSLASYVGNNGNLLDEKLWKKMKATPYIKVIEVSIDAGKKELVWQGVGSGVLTQDRDKKQERINEFAKEIMAQFPPKKDK